MSSLTFNRACVARCLTLVACLILGVLLLTLASGGKDESASGATRGGAGKARVVGKVTSVTGKVRGLTVNSPGGREHRLREGDQLHLNDVIDPDEGVEATFRLKVPNGVSGNDELVFIAPGKSDKHTVTMERTGKNETTVEIGD